jgi:hypothetical protein
VVERADGIEQAKDRPMADALHPQARAGDAILFFDLQQSRSELEKLHTMDPDCTREAPQRAWTLLLILEDSAIGSVGGELIPKNHHICAGNLQNHHYSAKL